jgi:hypothetical protein
MQAESLKIPKRLKQVTLWVHPEGPVAGNLFLRVPEAEDEEEEALEVLNQPDPFLVVQLEGSDEVRFYNKHSIVRVEYPAEETPQVVDVEMRHCVLQMMDGSSMEGTIRRVLPPDRARLFDYLNLNGERFLKIDCSDGRTYVINKLYIMCVTP